MSEPRTAAGRGVAEALTVALVSRPHGGGKTWNENAADARAAIAAQPSPEPRCWNIACGVHPATGHSALTGAALAAQPSIDVGRLARAIRKVDGDAAAGIYDADGLMEAEYAAAIARVYEKLRTPEGTDSLDAAWAEAEAALPEGWTLGFQSIDIPDDPASCLRAWAMPYPGRLEDMVECVGPTAAAALLALAEKLRTPEGEG